VIDHEAADELLAGYVLGSLSGPDAEAADRLLTEHVPDCLTCRATLDAFRGVTGELGLVANPLAPPDTLLPRMERELETGRRRRSPQWGPARLVAGAAAAVVLVGVVGLSLLNDGGSPSQLLTKADLAQVNQLKTENDARVTPIGPTETEAEEVSVPSRDELYVTGTFIANPGFIYRLYAVQDGVATYIGDVGPATGVVAFHVEVDPASVDHLLLREEPVASPPSELVSPSLEAVG
jgi:anti-sigma factor RsiW